MELNSNNIEKLLSYILDFSFLLPVLVYFFSIQKLKLNRGLTVLLAYAIFFFLYNIFFQEIKSNIGKKLYYFLYTLVEFSCFAIIISDSIRNKKLKKLFLLLVICFTLFLILFYTYGDIKTLDSIPIGVESIFLMVFVVSYFYSELKNVSSQNIYDSYSFWIVIGILIYIGFTFFFNILANSLDKGFLEKYFSYSYLGDILRNICFGISVGFMAIRASKENKKANSKIPYLDII